MAKCEKREIAQPAPPVEYVLTLSADEARAVYRVLQGAGCADGNDCRCPMKWTSKAYRDTDFAAVNRAINAMFNAGVRVG